MPEYPAALILYPSLVLVAIDIHNCQRTLLSFTILFFLHRQTSYTNYLSHLTTMVRIVTAILLTFLFNSLAVTGAPIGYVLVFKRIHGMA
jgi:hypothetical protein